MKNLLLTFAFTLALVSCSGNKAEVTSKTFGTLENGETVTVYHLQNPSGASAEILDYGCRIFSIKVPSKSGILEDVVVGPAELKDFESASGRFCGPVIGRYGNRIDHSSFTLDGVRYDLVANENFEGEPVQCHGGIMGFDRMIWEAEPFVEEDVCGVVFHRLSPDGEQGFPGNCDCYVTYALTPENVLKINYKATTDKPTVINLSNHTYINLKGNKGGYVMEHLLQVASDSAILNNSHFCPDLVFPVEGSPFDFREPHRVDYRIDMPNRHLEIMHGMSACWVLKNYDGTLRKAADLYEKESGIGVETWTTEPALLTFTGRTFNDDPGKYGPIGKFGGMLLETLHFADSPNQDRFPSTVLRPGEEYNSTTEFRFYVK